MRQKGEESGVLGGGKWGHEGREAGIGYPTFHPHTSASEHFTKLFSDPSTR